VRRRPYKPPASGLFLIEHLNPRWPNTMKTLHLGMTLLALTGTSTLAAPPEAAARAAPRPPPCQSHAPDRAGTPQGTLLWGTTRLDPGEEMSTVLASLQLGKVRLKGKALTGVRLEQGRLVSSSRSPQEFAGAILQGTTSSAQPVDVALCSAEPSSGGSLPWYRIEVWNAESASWENPCTATSRVPQPRALAVPGVWDKSGARQEKAGRFTFACETGAIAKCVSLGYAPWASKDEQPLAALHQACTRMLRADYCGDGRSHTLEGTTIDVYDSLGVQERTVESSAAFQPELASFEAAWGPEGASCLARTRHGQAVESILASCPDRFEPATVDLGGGDSCSLRRKGAGAALLRNRAYEPGRQIARQ
jgi:hypothetical protein